MTTNTSCYHGYRFPAEVISHAVYSYHRFSLSSREIEELLGERAVLVTYEAVRQWYMKFGPEYARNLRRLHGRNGDIRRLDEVFVKTPNGLLRDRSFKQWSAATAA
jgi:putative transposase